MRKAISLLLVLALALMCLCAVAMAEGKKVTIMYNSSFSDLSQMEESGLFEGFDVEWVSVAENDIDAKILLEMVSGSKSYDIAFTQASGAKQYGTMGLLEPLEPLPDWDDIFEANRQQHSVGDTIYGYPIIGDAYLLFYNTELFEKAGLDHAPTTLDEVKEYAKILTIDVNGNNANSPDFDKNNVVQYGWNYIGGTGNGNCWEFCTICYSNGGEYIAKDYNNMTYEVVCDSEVMVSSMQWLVDMLNEGLMPAGCISYDYNEYEEIFFNGTVAMQMNWPGFFNNQNGTVTEGKIQVAAIPSGAAGYGSGPMGGWSINVFKDAPHKADALEFAKIFASPAGVDAYQLASGGGRMIPRYSFFEKYIAAAEAENNATWVNYHNSLLTSAQVSKATDIAQTDACASDTQQIASRYINAILSGQYTPEEGLALMKGELETSLEDGGYMQ